MNMEVEIKELNSKKLVKGRHVEIMSKTKEKSVSMSLSIRFRN